jgi:hypothetical protein
VPRNLVGTPFRRNASRMSASVSTPSPGAAAFARRFVHGKRVLDGRLTVYWGDVVAAIIVLLLFAGGRWVFLRLSPQSRTSCKTVRMNSHLL